jgi:Ca2+-dependent lipid-binding protein
LHLSLSLSLSQLRVQSARNLTSPHRRLDLRLVVKVDGVIRAKTSVKSKTNAPEWNEDLEVCARHTHRHRAECKRECEM